MGLVAVDAVSTAQSTAASTSLAAAQPFNVTEWNAADDDDASSVDSAWSMPRDGARNAEYVDLCETTLADDDALGRAVRRLHEWQHMLTALSGLPSTVHRRMLVLMSALHRCRGTLHVSLSQAVAQLRRFSEGLVMSEEVLRLEREMNRRAAERDMARLELLENKRKLRACLAQLAYHQSDIAFFRWSRLVAKATHRDTVRTANKRLKRLRDHVTRQRRIITNAKTRLRHVLRIAELAAKYDNAGVVAAALIEAEQRHGRREPLSPPELINAVLGSPLLPSQVPLLKSILGLDDSANLAVKASSVTARRAAGTVRAGDTFRGDSDDDADAVASATPREASRGSSAGRSAGGGSHGSQGGHKKSRYAPRRRATRPQAGTAGSTAADLSDGSDQLSLGLSDGGDSDDDGGQNEWAALAAQEAPRENQFGSPDAIPLAEVKPARLDGVRRRRRASQSGSSIGGGGVAAVGGVDHHSSVPARIASDLGVRQRAATSDAGGVSPLQRLLDGAPLADRHGTYDSAGGEAEWDQQPHSSEPSRSAEAASDDEDAQSEGGRSGDGGGGSPSGRKRRTRRTKGGKGANPRTHQWATMLDTAGTSAGTPTVSTAGGSVQGRLRGVKAVSKGGKKKKGTSSKRLLDSSAMAEMLSRSTRTDPEQGDVGTLSAEDAAALRENVEAKNAEAEVLRHEIRARDAHRAALRARVALLEHAVWEMRDALRGAGIPGKRFAHLFRLVDRQAAEEEAVFGPDGGTAEDEAAAAENDILAALPPSLRLGRLFADDGSARDPGAAAGVVAAAMAGVTRQRRLGSASEGLDGSGSQSTPRLPSMYGGRGVGQRASAGVTGGGAMAPPPPGALDAGSRLQRRRSSRTGALHSAHSFLAGFMPDGVQPVDDGLLPGEGGARGVELKAKARQRTASQGLDDGTASGEGGGNMTVEEALEGVQEVRDETDEEGDVGGVERPTSRGRSATPVGMSRSGTPLSLGVQGGSDHGRQVGASHALTPAQAHSEHGLMLPGLGAAFQMGVHAVGDARPRTPLPSERARAVALLREATLAPTRGGAKRGQKRAGRKPASQALPHLNEGEGDSESEGSSNSQGADGQEAPPPSAGGDPSHEGTAGHSGISDDDLPPHDVVRGVFNSIMGTAHPPGIPGPVSSAGDSADVPAGRAHLSGDTSLSSRPADEGGVRPMLEALVSLMHVQGGAPSSSKPRQAAGEPAAGEDLPPDAEATAAANAIDHQPPFAPHPQAHSSWRAKGVDSVLLSLASSMVEGGTAAEPGGGSMAWGTGLLTAAERAALVAALSGRGVTVTPLPDGGLLIHIHGYMGGMQLPVPPLHTPQAGPWALVPTSSVQSASRSRRVLVWSDSEEGYTVPQHEMDGATPQRWEGGRRQPMSKGHLRRQGAQTVRKGGSSKSDTIFDEGGNLLQDGLHVVGTSAGGPSAAQTTSSRAQGTGVAAARAALARLRLPGVDSAGVIAGTALLRPVDASRVALAVADDGSGPHLAPARDSETMAPDVMGETWDPMGVQGGSESRLHAYTRRSRQGTHRSAATSTGRRTYKLASSPSASGGGAAGGGFYPSDASLHLSSDDEEVGVALYAAAGSMARGGGRGTHMRRLQDLMVAAADEEAAGGGRGGGSGYDSAGGESTLSASAAAGLIYASHMRAAGMAPVLGGSVSDLPSDRHRQSAAVSGAYSAWLAAQKRSLESEGGGRTQGGARRQHDPDSPNVLSAVGYVSEDGGGQASPRGGYASGSSPGRKQRARPGVDTPHALGQVLAGTGGSGGGREVSRAPLSVQPVPRAPSPITSAADLEESNTLPKPPAGTSALGRSRELPRGTVTGLTSRLVQRHTAAQQAPSSSGRSTPQRPATTLHAAATHGSSFAASGRRSGTPSRWAMGSAGSRQGSDSQP